MQDDNLKKDIQQIVDDLKSDGDELVKNFEKTLKQYQQELIAELSKSSTGNTDKSS